MSHYSILILEYSPENRSMYRSYLSQDILATYDVVEAETGLAAWAHLRQNQPDLILLAEKLPDMDGWEFLQQLRQQFDESQIPVIILAELGNEAIASPAKQFGASEFLDKSQLTCAKLCQTLHFTLETAHLRQQLKIQAQQQQFLARTLQRIHHFLQLDELFTKTVQELREFLQSDRVLLCQLNASINDTIIAESVLPQWQSCLKERIQDICSQETQKIADSHGEIRVIPDIYAAELTACHIELLEQFHVKANLVVPILLKSENQATITAPKDSSNRDSSPVIWGFLIVHQCSTTRQWQTDELDLLTQLSVHLAVAIQQAQMSENLQNLHASLAQQLQATTQERQAAVEALKASEAELRGLFKAMVDVILVVDKQGRYLKIAPTGADKLYLPPQELIGKTAHEILPNHLADQFVSLIGETLATQETRDCEYSLHVGNQDLWFHAKVSPISSETVIWAARDITAAKRHEIIQNNAEQALQENQILLRVIMDSLPMSIFWKDSNCRYLGCNRQFLVDAGLASTAEIVGKTDFDMVWQEQAPLYQADDRIVMESRQPKFNIEEPITKSGNISRWLRTNKVPLQNSDGETIGVLGSYEDITEQKEIEQALQQSERRYATLAASAPVGIFRTDAQGNCLYVNHVWCENTGLTPQQAAGEGWAVALHPEDRDIVAAQWHHLIETGETFSLEYRFLRPDGLENWVFGQAVPEKNSEGTVIGYIGTITNINRRKKAEAALRHSQYLYRTLVDNFPNGVFVLFDRDLRYLLVGGLEIARAGMKKSEMEGKTVWEIFPPETCEIIVPMLYKALAGESVIAEVPYQEFLYLVHYLPVRDEQGNVIAGILMTQNITERKQAENALRDSEEKFRQFAENSRQVMLLRQIDTGELLYVNPAYEEVWGRTCESLSASPNSWQDALHPDDVPRIEATYQATAGKGFFNEEYRIIRPDGSIRWIWGRCFPIEDLTGKIYRIGAIAEDITKRKQTEQERDRLLQVLESQNQTLEQEVARRTAELRAIIDTIPDFLFVIDRQEMRIIYCNGSFSYGVCQQPREQVEGKTIFEIFSEQDAAYFCQQNQQVLNSGELLRVQETINLPNHTYIFDTIKVPLKQANGEVYALVGTARDITTIKQLESALKQSENRFRNLVETSSDWVWEVNESGIYTYVSPQIIHILGYSPEEVLGKTPFDLMPKAEAERVLNEFMKFVSVQAPFQCLENTNRHKDGRLIILETSAVPIFDADNQFRGYRGMDRDITARKLSELALRESEARFQRLATNVPGVMYQYILHPDGSHEFPYISDRSQELWELEAATIMANADAVFNLVHPEDVPSIRETILLSASTLTQWSWEGRVITPSGHVKWIQGISQPQKQDNGDILWDGLVLDISDAYRQAEQRKRAQAKLQAAEIQLRNLSDRLKLAVKSAKIGIWDWDLLNDSILWDERMYELFGVAPMNFDITQAAWEKVEKLFHPDDTVALNAAIQQVIAKDGELDTEFRIILADGKIRTLKAYGLVQRNSQGQAQRMIGISYDISDSKLAEMQLQQTNQQLAASNAELARATRLKDEFLATMSHELRTPLNAILGLSEALQEGVFGTINHKQRTSLETIERSGNHLLELINDILDLSKIEAGHLELHYTQIAINPLCQASLTFIKQQAFQKRIQLKVNIQPHLPKLMVDERRIRQVLINLLNNAVKFTPEGGCITLEVTHQKLALEAEIASEQNFIRIAVIDTGIGIAPKNLHKLFQPFIQIDSALNRQYAGTGLGLVLVKRLVEIHGGKVGVTSELGVGSCFTVDLPCGSICEPAESVQPISSELNSTLIATAEDSPVILLAEDNEANILTFSGYLEAVGYRIILAKDGQEAIALSKTQFPNLILMDIQMPGVDGLEAIQQIRLDPNCTDIPIIALTALAMPGDREKCLASGANEYLCKPVKLQQLAALIQQLLEAHKL